MPPELLAFAQQTFNMDEFEEEVRQIRAGNGVPFEVLIAEVETLVRQS